MCADMVQYWPNVVGQAINTAARTIDAHARGFKYPKRIAVPHELVRRPYTEKKSVLRKTPCVSVLHYYTYGGARGKKFDCARVQNVNCTFMDDARNERRVHLRGERIKASERRRVRAGRRHTTTHKPSRTSKSPPWIVRGPDNDLCARVQSQSKATDKALITLRKTTLATITHIHIHRMCIIAFPRGSTISQRTHFFAHRAPNDIVAHKHRNGAREFCYFIV